MKYGPEKWDERYADDKIAYGKEPNNFLKQNVDSLPKGAILCVADGEGRNGVWLAKQGYEVTSIDFSANAINKINRYATESNVNINAIQADLLNFDFGINKYEAIVAIFSHFNSEDTKRLYKQYFEALKPGGIFFMEAFAKEQLPLRTGGPKDINLLYDTDIIAESFSQMETVILKKDVVWLHEGELHEGKAVVVRAILKKPIKI